LDSWQRGLVVILEDAYKAHMRNRDLATSTIETNLTGLRKIERDTGLNLEDEFKKDQLSSLLRRLQYTREDEAASRPNPSNLVTEPRNLFVNLGWYRNVLERYRNFRLLGTISDTQPLTEDVAETPEEEALGRTFKLEDDLQKALRANIAQLEDGLTIADGGKEYKVEAGYIDILAKDKNGGWVVIELKAGDAKPDSVAQVLSYMSCIAEDKKAQTRGILIAADFVPRVRWAVKSVPTLMLQKYRFNFAFDNV
jgi:hypothetical protein